jgi:hypothetical protein
VHHQAAVHTAGVGHGKRRYRKLRIEVPQNVTFQALLEFQEEPDVFEGVVHAGPHKWISFHFAQSKENQLKIKLSMDSC